MDASNRSDGNLLNSTETSARRRKVRKGTFSCWECKRLKMKCVFDPSDNTICVRCRRKRCPCIGQEFSNAPFVASSLRTASAARSRHNGKAHTNTTSEVQPDLSSNDHSASRGVEKNSGIDHPPCPRDHDSLSQALYDSLPRREDLEEICKASKRSSVLYHEVLIFPYTTLEQNGFRTAETLLEMPRRNSHPVMLARYMLQLALFLQRQHPDLPEKISTLSESPRSIMLRIADLAIWLITTNDEFLGSVESLECVMMESVYKSNGGNLRQGWLVNRRAMNMAQLMGLHQSHPLTHFKLLDPKSNDNPQFLWYRIVDNDRYLCLMLGLPQGSTDRSMASDKALANDTAMGSLERVHCVIASGILERNERKADLDTLHLTRMLDRELQKAARMLPSRWWMVPDFSDALDDPQKFFWDVRRLVVQVGHYYLLNQLHLPFMLRPSSEERNHEYSRITCVNASREVLTRFTFLRKFNKYADCCRLLDFLAIMAAMTLLLAHLDSHQLGSDNLLAHQYLSDRAMIERVQENMEDLNRVNSDALSAQSADLLRRLLALEIDVDGGSTGNGENISIQLAGADASVPQRGLNSDIVTMQIPYFGTIKITRNGVSKDFFRERNHYTASVQTAETEIEGRPGIVSAQNLGLDSRMLSSAFMETVGISSEHDMVRNGANNDYAPLDSAASMFRGAANNYGKFETQRGSNSNTRSLVDRDIADFNSQPQLGVSNHSSQSEGDPGLIAGAEEWAFQGVDMAFFESLMSTVGSGNADWTSAESFGSSMNM